MTVRIVTDSTADIPAELLAGLDVTVVPLNVHFGEKTYRDQIDLTSQEFLRMLTQSSVLPTTSQPSAGLFQETYERLAPGADGIISIQVSTKLSGTFESAQLGKASSSTNCPIEVVDSKLTTIGLGQVVLAAARMAAAGEPMDSILEMVNYRSNRTHIIFFVDTLEYLQKGGRIGRASALLGTLLNLKPVLRVINGEVNPVERIRTRSKAIERLVEIANGFPHIEELAIMHSGCLEDAKAVAQKMDKKFPTEKIIIGDLGPVVCTHVGPGVVGFSIYEG